MPRESGPATVHVVKPALRNMTSPLVQPGFVEAYEETAIFSKVSGFIKEFSVDIGDEVKKDQVLCEIFVPELEQQHEQKVAQVETRREHGQTGSSNWWQWPRPTSRPRRPSSARRRQTWENTGRRSSVGSRN